MATLENITENLQDTQENFEKLLAVALEYECWDEAKDIISNSHIADLAGFFNRSLSQQKIQILNIINDSQIAELIIELDRNIIHAVVEMLGAEKAARVLNQLDVDEAIYVLDSIEDDFDLVILQHLKGKAHKDLREGLSYPEGSAGRLMQKKFVSVPEHWTVKQTMEYLNKENKKKNLPQIFYEIFITDPKFNPIGIIPLSLLVVQSQEVIISNIMTKDVKYVTTDLDKDDISYLFKKYGLVTVPVVNKHNRLVGSITLEDVVDVIDKTAEENIMHMGGVGEDDVHLNLLEVIKSRFPWLLISLFATTICSFVINLFHDTIQQAIVLSSIMPIVAGISGNAGTQTMTVTVLSLHSKELTALNITRVIFKQIISCSCNGLMLAVLGGGILGILYQNFLLSIVFGLAIIISFALAGFFGSVIPLILNRLGFDPSIASPVFVTTLTDMISFAVFLSLATKILL